MTRDSLLTVDENDKEIQEAFNKYDALGKGHLSRIELQEAVEDLTNQEFSMDHIEILFEEFDRSQDGKVDFPEFKIMMKYLESTVETTARRKSIELNDLSSFNNFGKSYTTYGSSAQELGMSVILDKCIKKAQTDKKAILKRIAKDIFPVKDMLCIQDDIMNEADEEEDSSDNIQNMHRSMALDFDNLFDDDEFGVGDSDEDSLGVEEESTVANPMDPDFVSAFPASEMRCLALVSHNGMKKTMREFVTANKNLLKKFRLTGTNSTMTMLKEVFADEPHGTVVYGPACASGPLGGDAELVAYMVSGKIGGVIFFQDPMSPHPHRADIDCLVRQALVHNVVMAETPSSALMICSTLRQALIGKGKPELIPSFFFSLQSPTVEEYKRGQKAVVDAQKALVRAS